MYIHTNTQTHTHIYIYIHVYPLYIYIYMFIYIDSREQNREGEIRERSTELYYPERNDEELRLTVLHY